MSVTYTVTEADGYQHTRTSRGDNSQRYTHALVRVPHGSKAQVSYHSTLALAQATLAACQKPLEDNGYTRQRYPEKIGKPYYDQAKIYPVEAVVKAGK